MAGAPHCVILSLVIVLPIQWSRWFESQKIAYNYHGKAGEAHRVFVFNADTYIEAGERPWAKPPEATGFDYVLDFMHRQQASADILL